MTHTDVVSTLFLLTHTPPSPERRATLTKYAGRVLNIQARHDRAKDEFLVLAEQITRLEMKALVHKIEPTSWPAVGRVFHAGTALLGHLDGDLVELRDAVRAAHAALTEPEQIFIRAIQALERAIEREETNAANVDSLAKVLDAALATLAEAQFVSAEFVVPQPLPGVVTQFNSQPAPTSAA